MARRLSLGELEAAIFTLPVLKIKSEGLGQKLCDVAHAHWHTMAVAHPGNVHRATGIVADQCCGSGRGNAVHFILHDRAADFRILHRESPAEPAALVGLFQARKSTLPIC